MKNIVGKVVVLGSQGVGKTSIIVRYVENVVNRPINPTIGASFFTCKLNIADTEVKLQVWDTAGEERFKSMAPMYYRNANAAMLVFDVTRYNSFAAIKNWVTELKRNVEEQMVLTVIGNKSDLFNDREVDTEEGRCYANKIGATYHETSVIHNDGIEKVFLAIANGLISLSSGNTEITSALRITDSNNFGLNNSGILLTPSEEIAQNPNIALGINEKIRTCC
ncbi:ras-related protein RabJ [Vespa velutina]|uniref:ras-related protein RabJ n=1 Tax=Vespa crabro TaxID=7445 RepID=UPI001F02F085|nr:ras-related protein RabJ [Vespa crabro]XP_047344551.1 ras-related protein RabJ [Vespa velutina]